MRLAGGQGAGAAPGTGPGVGQGLQQWDLCQGEGSLSGWIIKQVYRARFFHLADLFLSSS